MSSMSKFQFYKKMLITFFVDKYTITYNDSNETFLSIARNKDGADDPFLYFDVSKMAPVSYEGTKEKKMFDVDVLIDNFPNIVLLVECAEAFRVGAENYFYSERKPEPFPDRERAEKAGDREWMPPTAFMPSTCVGNSSRTHFLMNISMASPFGPEDGGNIRTAFYDKERAVVEGFLTAQYWDKMFGEG